MKYSMDAATAAIKVFVPTFGITVHLQMPEALNMAAVEAFLNENDEGRYGRARRIIRTAIHEIRADGQLKFGKTEW